jgi:hypothetical protein
MCQKHTNNLKFEALSNTIKIFENSNKAKCELWNFFVIDYSINVLIIAKYTLKE